MHRDSAFSWSDAHRHDTPTWLTGSTGHTHWHWANTSRVQWHGGVRHRQPHSTRGCVGWRWRPHTQGGISAATPGCFKFVGGNRPVKPCQWLRQKSRLAWFVDVVRRGAGCGVGIARRGGSSTKCTPLPALVRLRRSQVKEHTTKVALQQCNAEQSELNRLFLAHAKNTRGWS